MRWLILFVVLFTLLFVIACDQIPEELSKKLENKEVVKETEQPTQEIEDVVEEPEITEPALTTCEDSRDCEAGKQCINSECKTIEELYDTACENKCNFNQAVVKTSDGETYTIRRGESSYTSAGALAWKLLPGPDYCPGGEVIVPIELEKISYGEVLNKQTITLGVGETSGLVTHPTVSSVNFKLTVEEVNEQCN